MRLTIGRWVAAILGCCAFVAVLLLPLPKKAAPTTWFGQAPAGMSASVEALAAAAADRNDAIRDYRVAQGVARWKTQHAADIVQIDPATPARVAEFMRTVVQNEWHRVGSSASASHATVFVYYDTSTFAGIASPNNRRTAEVRRPADVWFALPQITDGERCVVLVRVRATTVAEVKHLSERSVLGPCAYFAAFGKPGTAVRRWLDATNYRAALLPDWDKPRAPVVDPSAIYTLDTEASRCLTGDRRGCADALGMNALTAGSGTVGGNSLGEGSRGRALVLGEAAPRLLADAAREYGLTRFARFWTSNAPLDSAFAGAAGVSLTEWTGQWLEGTYGKPQRSRSVQLHELFWLAVLIPVLLLIAAGRRERVLAERLELAPASPS